MSSESATVRTLFPAPSLSARSGRLVRSWCFGAALVTALVAVLWIPRILGSIDLRYDAGVYYVLGTSLAEGRGYRILSEPGAPTGIQYPPGLPALVAAHQLVLDTNDPEVVGQWLRWTYAAMYLGLGLAVFTLGRRYGGQWVGLAAAFLCLCQSNTFLLSDMLFTELPFTLVAVGFALLMVNQRMEHHPIGRESAGFLLAFTGFMLRTAGLALLFAWVVEALVRRRWRLASMRLVLAAVPFLLWQGHVMQVQSSEEYRAAAYEYQRAPYQYYNVSYAENLALIDPFTPERGYLNAAAVVRRVAANLRVLPATLGEVVSEHAGFWRAALHSVLNRNTPTGPVPSFMYVPLWLLAFVVVTGMLVLARNRAWFIIAMVIASIGLVLTTPWPAQFPRYLTPLSPFLAIAAVLGAIAIGQWLSRRFEGWRGTLGIGVLSGLFVVTALVQAYAVRNSFLVRYYSAPVGADAGKIFTPKWFYHDNTWTDWANAVAWIEQNAPAEAIIATSSPHLTYLKTGRPSVMPPMEPDPSRAAELMKQVPISYVIIDELQFVDLSRRYALPAMMHDPSQWRRVYQEKKTSIYENASESGNGTIRAAPRREVPLM